MIRIIPNDYIEIYVVNYNTISMFNVFEGDEEGGLKRFDVDKSYLLCCNSAQEIEQTEGKLAQLLSERIGCAFSDSVTSSQLRQP